MPRSNGEGDDLEAQCFGVSHDGQDNVEHSLSCDEDQTNLPLVLVLLGRVGVGKSSTANSILGPALGSPFVARRAASAITRNCQSCRTVVGDQEILVLDTPGLGDAAVEDSEIHSEIRRGLNAHVPKGARVCLIFIFSFQARVGDDEISLLSGLEQHVFGPGLFYPALVAWTHADMLDPGEGIESYLVDADERLKDMLNRVSGGQIALNNRNCKADDPQISELIEKTAAVAGPCPTAKLRVEGMGGRKSSRRRRQIEAGLLRKQKRGCAIS